MRRILEPVDAETAPFHPKLVSHRKLALWILHIWVGLSRDRVTWELIPYNGRKIMYYFAHFLDNMVLTPTESATEEG